jgi:HD-GYP domain-containing protein (c-di-GMP phosphodiesterase class II)
MSWARRSAGRSSAPEAEQSDFSLAALVRGRGVDLIDALERRLPGSREHAEASATYAFAAAVGLGHDRAHSELVRDATKLHEIGRIYIPAAVLAKPTTALEPSERAQLERHPEAGAALARGAGIPESVCGWLLRARERFDGSGPEGLAGDEIPVESRIIAAACSLDRLLTAPAGAPLDDRRRAATAELRDAAGGALDPDVVEALAAVLARAGA